MDPERWRQIEDIYHRAAARPPGERAAVLAAACGSDQALRAEVQLLLEQGESAAGWLDRGAALAAPVAAPLRDGQRLGDYEIRGLLGTGGMGQVHRAYDTRLRREVAIKILPLLFLNDRDRLTRFEREARVLASLNHPNVGAIYGLEEARADSGDPIRALVLELVEGPTLADRIARGALRVAEATKIAVQIADALEAAHEKGIVHRDVKPANIKITPQGAVKVLDFGIATAVGAPESGALTNAPTVDGDHTQPGTLIGTVSYMSPEQARGQAVDRRTDVWAFGCVLYEMLTGRRAFDGSTMSDTIAGILERDPDWAALPAATPAAVHRVLRWALAKDPDRRLRALGDARLELEAADAGESRGTARRGLPGWAVAAAVLASGIVGAVASRILAPAPAAEPTRLTSNFAIPVGRQETLPRNVAISPDGRYIAYLAGPSGNQKTYLRPVGARQSRVISELPLQATQPFFSPDSQWVAFFDAGKLKKLPVGGGPSVTLAEAPTPRGGTWGADGTIVFAPISRGGLAWLPASGGPPQTLTTPDGARLETSHRFPAFLADSRTVVFLAESTMPSDRALSLQAVSLETKQVTVISQGQAVTPRYVPTGHIAYKVGGRLVATPFDIATLRVTAPPVTVMEDVDTFSFSADGTLVYSSVDPGYNIRASTPVWVDRDGSITALPLPAGVYDHPRLSPDGRAVVLTREMEGDRSLWVYDTARVTLSKLTFSSRSDWPVWGPGDRILYGSNRAGTQYDILWTPVDRSGPEDDFLVLPLTQIPRAVSPAGDILIFEETYADRPNTLWRMPLDPRGEPRPLFATANGEMMPTFSPDGRWVAYVSGQSERSEVYVRSSTGEGRIWPISNDGGVEPVWSFSGRELFYRADDRMMVVDVTPSDPIAFGKPRVLFEGVYLFGTTEGQEFDVTRDGKRFLMLTPQQLPVATPLNVVVNWFDDLRRRVPGAADSD